MGMMLRRKNRKPEENPKVNGKPVKREPKNRSLTETAPRYERKTESQYS